MKQDIYLAMKLVHVNVDQIQVFVHDKQRWNNGKCRCECR